MNFLTGLVFGTFSLCVVITILLLHRRGDKKAIIEAVQNFERKDDTAHTGLYKLLVVIGGRLQWLVANNIAEELGRIRAGIIAGEPPPSTPTQGQAMRLVELEACFMECTDDAGSHRGVAKLADAHGVKFLCPKCYRENGGRVGTHQILCWFVGKVADSVTPGPGRWIPRGTAIQDLTFVPGDPPRLTSVQLTGGCGWHGHIINGNAEDIS
jgi:hypothetical protein